MTNLSGAWLARQKGDSMTGIKAVIHCEYTPPTDCRSRMRYRVTKVTNTTDFLPGDQLDKNEIAALILQGCKVVVVERKAGGSCTT